MDKDKNSKTITYDDYIYQDIYAVFVILFLCLQKFYPLDDDGNYVGYSVRIKNKKTKPEKLEYMTEIIDYYFNNHEDEIYDLDEIISLLENDIE